jgi:hypothetical protein
MSCPSHPPRSDEANKNISGEKYKFTERRGSVVITPASYSAGHGFKSRPKDRLSQQVSRDFPRFLQTNAGI